MKAVMIAATLGLALARPAAAIDLNGTLWSSIASEVGVDPVLAYSVGLIESTRATGGQGAVTPWPWTIRSADGAVIAKSRPEAKAALVRALATSRNVDVGLMQINIGANGHRVASPADLLEPAVQLRVGMTILKEAIQSSPGDIELGVGRYHSWSPLRARAYGRAVLATYHRLQAYSWGKL